MDFDLRLFHHFVTVAEHRSFTTAAHELHVTQPALSQSIQRLERLVGVALFERTRVGARRVELTAAGSDLLEDAVTVLAAARASLARARRTGLSEKEPPVIVGFTTSTPQVLIQACLAVGDLGSGESDDLERDDLLQLLHIPWGNEAQRLQEGRLDIAIVQSETAVAPDSFERRVLMEQPRVAVFFHDHPLARRETVSLSELSSERIVNAGPHRDFWLIDPRPDGRSPVVVGAPATTVEEMLAAVAAKRGMAITSAAIAETHARSNLRFVPIDDVEPLEISAIWLRQSHPRAQTLHVLDAIQEQLRLKLASSREP